MLAAFLDLQEALAAARFCLPAEVRIAQGVYKPAPFDGSRAATFLVPDEVSLFGGYAGWGEPDPKERDTDVYETVLSGDLHENDEVDSSTQPCSLSGEQSQCAKWKLKSTGPFPLWLVPSSNTLSSSPPVYSF